MSRLRICLGACERRPGERQCDRTVALDGSRGETRSTPPRLPPMTRPEAARAASVTPERTLRVAGLVYVVGREEVFVAHVDRGSCRWLSLGSVRGLLEPAAALRDELADPMKVSRNRVPRLREFATGWGRDLLPREVLEEPPDVLVIVPHELIHQLPLQLVAADDGRALAVHAGIAYCSSVSLFCRIMRRPRRPGHPARVAGAAGIDVLDDGEDRFVRLADDVARWFPVESDDAEPAQPAWLATSSVKIRADDDSREMLRRLHGSTDVSAAPALDRFRAKRLLHKRSAEVVCLVAHGFVDPQRHANSGLLVAPTIDTWRDLRVYDRMMSFPDRALRDTPVSLPIKRDAEVLALSELELEEPSTVGVVMLVACSAGASTLLRADEPGSLAESLLRRGASSVIAPMWDCDFELAHTWAHAFLDAWTTGATPVAVAMREAFGSLADGRDPAALGPFHLRGDWR